MAIVLPMNTAPEPEFVCDFETFWLLYPRHEAKKSARISWERISNSDQLAAITSIVDWRLVWRMWGRDTSRIPLAATWLNGERWADEVPIGILPAKVREATKAEPFERGEIPPHVKEMIARLKAGQRLK